MIRLVSDEEDYVVASNLKVPGKYQKGSSARVRLGQAYRNGGPV